MPTVACEYQTSGPPYVSVIFGHVFDAVQAVQDAPRRPAAHRVGVVAPPERSFGPGLVQLRDVARFRKSRIEAAEHAGDARIQAIPDDAATLVFVETQIQKRLREATRLRVALAMT